MPPTSVILFFFVAFAFAFAVVVAAPNLDDPFVYVMAVRMVPVDLALLSLDVFDFLPLDLEVDEAVAGCRSGKSAGSQFDIYLFAEISLLSFL